MNNNHCDCPECQKDRELLRMMREYLPLLMMIARAQATASQTVANKWRDLEGETKFRKVTQDNGVSKIGV